ncbi:MULTISPECIES: hypothetical protein [Sphingobium]|jgi:hypothetical protein|uniref:hypothetical protein n=1 Tax=Sphingobium TaxID=165695 RepID=UPI000DB40D67|nr:hypothetical protein [Sphingobium sp.]PZU70905.1 MAG: hypothetical protein DI540_00140 [Sphingobium sp.]
MAIVDADGLALLQIDTAQMLDDGGGEMLAGLLALTDDRDASLPLIVYATTRSMLLAGHRFLVRPVSE